MHHETSLPRFVLNEFQDYLRCGRLKYGFVRVKCSGCRHEHLAAFSCKRRGFCPSCGARRMIETSAHLVDHVFPEVPASTHFMHQTEAYCHSSGEISGLVNNFQPIR